MNWFQQVNQNIHDWCKSIHGPWLDGPMRDITALGGITVTVLVSTVAVISFWLLGRKREAGFFAGFVAGSALLVVCLKLLIGEPCPPESGPFYPRSPEVLPGPPRLPCMPSGHTVGSLVLWGSLALLWPIKMAEGTSRFDDDTTPSRRFLLACALAQGGAVAVSRVYLLEHWFWDVVLAYPLGLAILWLEHRLLKHDGV